MDCSRPGFPVLHCLPESAQTHVHWVGSAIQPSHPLLPLPLLPWSTWLLPKLQCTFKTLSFVLHCFFTWIVLFLPHFVPGQHLLCIIQSPVKYDASASLLHSGFLQNFLQDFIMFLSYLTHKRCCCIDAQTMALDTDCLESVSCLPWLLPVWSHIS